jgi:predicted GNAT family acetyltransferase
VLELIAHDTIDRFLAVAGPTLAQDEVTNGLILGVALRLQHDPARFEQRPYLATVTEGDLLRAAAVMTPPHGVIVYAATENPVHALRLIADNLVTAGWSVPTVNGIVQLSRTFAEAWCNLTGGDFCPVIALRVYELRAVIPPLPVPGAMRPATAADIELVHAWFHAFRDEATPTDAPPKREHVARSIAEGSIYLWEDGGRAVSLAGKGRRTPRGVSIGPVYTPLEWRGRGYASACVAALSQMILDEGKEFCTLFTDLANPTSNNIYQKIGYRPVCDFTQFALLGSSSLPR